MDIKQNKQNLLLKRKEIIFNIASGKNPSFDEMKKLLAEKFSISEENVDVKSIFGGFGRDNFQIKAFVYDSKKDLDAIKILELTSKQREEIKKAAEEAKKKAEEAKKAEGTKNSEAEIKTEDKSEANV